MAYRDPNRFMSSEFGIEAAQEDTYSCRQTVTCVTAPLSREGFKRFTVTSKIQLKCGQFLRAVPHSPLTSPRYTKPELAAKPVPNAQVTPCQCFPGGLSELTWTAPRHSAGTAAAPQQRGFVRYPWCQATPTDTEAFQPCSASCYPLLTASARGLENRTKHLLSCCSVQLPQQWLKLFLSQRLQVNASVTSTGLEMLSRRS